MNKDRNENRADWAFNIDIDQIRSADQAAQDMLAELPEPSDIAEPDPEPAAFMRTPRERLPEEIAAEKAQLPEPIDEPEDYDEPAGETVVIPVQAPVQPQNRPVRRTPPAGYEPTRTTNAVRPQQRPPQQRPPQQRPPQQRAAQRPAPTQQPVKPMTPAQQRKQAKADKKRAKRLARVERSRQRPKFRFAPVLAALLAITNVMTLGALGLNYMQTAITVDNADKTVADAAKSVENVRAEMTALENASIPKEKLQYMVAEYNITTEFIQEFFDDRIVYKDNSVVYAEIDPELPKNNYDWSALTWENGRPDYQPQDSRHSTFGIDVSYHQGEIDWGLVAADGVEFAMIRAGYRGYGTGELIVDDNFPFYMSGAAKSGIQTGVYFFSQAIDAGEAVEEAEFVLSLIKDYEVTMPIVLDMEIMPDEARANDLTSAQRTEIAKAFCDTIAAAGYTPAVYGNTAYLLSKVDFAELAGKYEIWLAQYYDKPFFPYPFSIWQYTDQGTVSGIEGKVDLNLYFGSGNIAE